MKELEINVIGMHCGGCEKRVQNIISEMKEIKDVKADYKTGKVKIVLKKEINESIFNKIKTRIEDLEDFKVE